MADSCLVAGVIVVAVAVLRNIDFDGSRVTDESAAEKGSADKGSAEKNSADKDPADG